MYLQFAIQCNGSNPMNAMLNMQFVKPLLTKYNSEILKAPKEKSKRNDSIAVHNPIDAQKYGVLCSSNLETHIFDVQIQEAEYSRLINPFLSTTSKDFCSIKRIGDDTITFWNWNAHKNTESRINYLPMRRTTLPPLKKVVSRNYLSETKAKF